MSDDGSLDPSPVAPREEMISTAVRFLQNPKVTQSTLGTKRAFLEKKGLKTEEIDLAIARAGVTETAANSQGPAGMMVPQPGAYAAGLQPLVHHLVPVSTWTRVKDYTAIAVILGGLTYAIYKFYKKYILPIWFGPSCEERQLAAMNKSITELQTSITEMLKHFKEVQGSMNKQQNQMDAISLNSSATRLGSSSEDNLFVKEIKDEIKSLKGLLLSRKQFPPTPASQPVLPAWQLAALKTEERVTADDTLAGTEALTAGQKPSGNSPAAQVPAGDISADQASTEYNTAGEAPTENVPAVNMSPDQGIAGNVPTGQVPVEEISGGVIETTQHCANSSQDSIKDSPLIVNGYLSNGDSSLDGNLSDMLTTNQNTEVIGQSSHLPELADSTEHSTCTTTTPDASVSCGNIELSS